MVIDKNSLLLQLFLFFRSGYCFDGFFNIAHVLLQGFRLFKNFLIDIFQLFREIIMRHFIPEQSCLNPKIDAINYSQFLHEQEPVSQGIAELSGLIGFKPLKK